MRVVVIGATGNVGLALLRALAQDERVDDVIAVARRQPRQPLPGTKWMTADIARDVLAPVVAGADAVVHLAWLIQPSRDPQRMHQVNVAGTARLLEAVAEAEVPAFVYASSVGAYSPGPREERVDESWPTHGIATSSYGRQKAYVERMLDAFEARHADVRVVRLRPGLIFQTEAAASQRRYFAGPLLPRGLLRPGTLPVMPHLAGVRFQAVHASDVADAYVLALHGDAGGAFNVAADDVLSTLDIADLLEARPLQVPRSLARGALDLSWRLRLHPLSPGWLDLAVQAPIMDTTRARTELGWTPRYSGRDALQTVLRGIAEGAAGPTPVLQDQSVVEQITTAARTGMGQRATDRPDV